MMVQGSGENRFADAKTVSSLLAQLAGAVSVCWENPSGAGVFESERAVEFVNEAEKRLYEILSATKGDDE